MTAIVREVGSPDGLGARRAAALSAPCYASSVSSASPVSAARTRLRFFARPSTLFALAPVSLAAAGVLSAVLMLIGLGRRPLWFDETVSVEAAKLPASSLAHYVASTESNMSLYHVLLHLWLLLNGGDAFARALSVVFGLATLPLVYALARRLFDTRAAVIAVFVIAGNVNFVGHAREARGYSLAVLLVTASSLFLVMAVQDGRRRHWALYAVTGVLAVYAHLLAALAILAQLLSLLVLRSRIPMRWLIVSVAGGVLLLAPLVVAVATHSQGRQIDWVTAPRLRQLPGLLYWYTGSWVLTALILVGSVVALATAYVELRRQPSALRIWPYALVVSWLVFPPLAAFAISFAKPVYLYRYFLVSLPALAILVAVGLSRIGRAWILASVVLLFVALSTRTTAACTPGCVIGQDDWRAAAAYVASEMRPGDGLLFDPGELRTPFAHYLQGARPRLLDPARWALVGGPVEGAATPAAALARARSARRVWLVTWWLPRGDVPARLTRARGRPAVHDFAGNVLVRLYGPPRS
jgi:mannosyltransferase